MTPERIISDAYLRGLVPHTLYGLTQHKTLHARLSEDIFNKRSRSRFIRTGPGIFYLRSEEDSKGTLPREIIARPRWKELNKFPCLALKIGSIPSTIRADTPTSMADFDLISNELFYTFRDQNKRNEDVVFIRYFVVIHSNMNILSYRNTKNRFMLSGKRMIGLSGCVYDFDFDFTYNSLFGILGGAAREIGDAFVLDSRLVDDIRYGEYIKSHFFCHLSKSDVTDNFLTFVLSFSATQRFGNLSIESLASPRWSTHISLSNRLGDFDSFSNFLIECGELVNILEYNL